MSKEFGDFLRQHRLELGLTQKQVAEILNIDRSTYAYYECGTTEPSFATIRRLAKLFDVAMEDMLPEEDDKRFARVSVGPKGLPKNKDAVDKNNEERLLFLYRNLSPQQKEEVLAFVRQLKKK